MSYDLAVFDPDDAPRSRAAFKEWFDRQTQWSEGHDYNDPAFATPALRAWFTSMRSRWPNMNGPGASQDYDDPHVTDYSIGHHCIYAAFRWNVAEEAYADVRRLAVKNAVGFYDVSGDEGDGEIHFPGDALNPPSQGAWREVSRQFKELDKR